MTKRWYSTQGIRWCSSDADGASLACLSGRALSPQARPHPRCKKVHVGGKGALVIKSWVPSGTAAGPHVKRVRFMFSAIARHGVSELRDGEIAPAWARRSDKSPRFSLTKSVIQKSGNGNFAPADC